MPISVEKLRKKLLAAISIGNFQKVEKCVEEAEYNAPHKLDQKKMVDPSRKVKG